MSFNSDEYGAPWNDQCYTVQFYLTVMFDEIVFTSNSLSKEICLKGPRKYTEEDLKEAAIISITEIYQDLFNYDNFLIHIVKID